jgi:peptidoglycan lytic transglycosylase
MRRITQPRLPRVLRPGLVAVLTSAIVALAPGTSRLRAQSTAVAGEVATTISATPHSPVPTELEDVWLVPDDKPTTAMKSLAKAVDLIANAKYVEAAKLLAKPSLEGTPLADYERYYTGLLAIRRGRVDEAQQLFASLVANGTPGYLCDLARMRAGEAAEQRRDFAAASQYYEPLTRKPTLAPDDAWTRLARVKRAAGDASGAAEAYAHVYYEFPLSDLATTAAAEIGSLNAWGTLDGQSPRYKLEYGRAERLFGSGRYAQARDGFAMVRPFASGDEREVVELRLAECDYYLRRYAAARNALTPWLDQARRRAEARFFYLGATRELGEHAEYVRQAMALADAFPTESWAEDALNNLATHYILTDEDDKADTIFREVVRRFPDGRYTPRALWKIGWYAYRNSRWPDAASTFERAALKFPRSDYRPTWIYWAARSRDQVGDSTAANRLYGVLVADYLNSYYGRLASKTLTARRVEPMTMAAAVAPQSASSTDAVPATSSAGAKAATTAMIQQLISAELWDDALNELLWLQKTSADTPAVRATLGYVYAQKGDLRRGINAVKRAYPQYLSAAGEDLPPAVLQVLFPVAYWDLIRTHANAQKLDPYLVAALMAQESTFDAGIKSHANAIGLMQIVPSTGRVYARRLRVSRYSAARLTDPAVNVRIGTAYFADLVDRFGGVPYALASYNAGPAPVARWMAERPGIAADEFIDDIPYPETQNYVRKILGTAEDYRRLYGELGLDPVAGPPASGAFPTPKMASSKVAKKKAAIHRAGAKKKSKSSATHRRRRG